MKLAEGWAGVGGKKEEQAATVLEESELSFTGGGVDPGQAMGG